MEQGELFSDLPRIEGSQITPRFRPLSPIWTRNKAQLIERYLYYFVQITKHGTYIDGFAGPQRDDGGDDLWSAKLVLASRPPWLRHFHLFDSNRNQVRRLEAVLDTVGVA